MLHSTADAKVVSICTFVLVKQVNWRRCCTKVSETPRVSVFVLCTSKASKVSQWRRCCTRTCRRQGRQYLYFYTSKASKLAQVLYKGLADAKGAEHELRLVLDRVEVLEHSSSSN